MPKEGIDLLKKISSFIFNDEKIQLYRSSERDFTRKSPLGFSTVVSLILHQFREGVGFNLHQWFGRLDKNRVSGGAFTQARAKVSHQFFKDLAQTTYSAYIRSPRLFWKGFTLVGTDGSTFNLPVSDELKEYYGLFTKAREGPARILSRYVAVFDVLNSYLFGVEHARLTQGEQDMALSLYSEVPIPKKSIYLFDRGYFSRRFLQCLVDSQKRFCIRIHDNGAHFIQSFIKSGEMDVVLEWSPSKGTVKSCALRGVEATNFPIRLIRFKLPNNKYMYLATNLLDQKKYTYNDLVELYNLRWGVEEGIKKSKAFMKVEMFGAKTVHGIQQEVYAHQVMMNIVSIMGMEAQLRLESKLVNRKFKYKYTWTNAYRLVRKHLYDLLYYKRRDRLLDALVEMIANTVTAVVDGRKFFRYDTKKSQPHRVTGVIKQG